MEKSLRVLTENPAGGYRSTITNGVHTLIADEPTELEGTNEGLTPMEHLAGALGACTAITLRMYASRKAMKLNDIAVIVRTETHENQLHFIREIQLLGELSDEEKARLLQIANKCPVHKVLSAANSIETILV